MSDKNSYQRLIICDKEKGPEVEKYLRPISKTTLLVNPEYSEKQWFFNARIKKSDMSFLVLAYGVVLKKLR